jgi:hypothetical protein
MDGVSWLFVAGLGAILAGVLWTARGWSGLDARRAPLAGDPKIDRSERDGTVARGGAARRS